MSKRKHNRRRARSSGEQGSSGGKESLSTVVLRGGAAGCSGDQEGLETAVLLLQERAAFLGHPVVDIVLGDVFCGVLATRWEQGWQPAEIARAVSRAQTARHRELVLIAMGADAAWSAAKGADSPLSWQAQLEGLGVHQSLAGPGWVGAWVGRCGIDRIEAAFVALETLGILMGLPTLQLLLPPPSQWAAGQPTATSYNADDPMLTKVRALLAKAESTTFDAEADALTGKAQQLMARHAIDEALTRQTGNHRGEIPIARRFAIDDPYASAKSHLLSVVTASNGGRAVWFEPYALMTVVAFATELDAIDTLFTSLLIQATRALLSKGKVVDRRGRSRTRSYRQSFLVSFAYRIHERLELANAAALSDAEEELNRSLLPVLAGRDGEVDDAVGAMFPSLGRRREPRITNRDGWIAGRTAAELAALGPGGSLTRGAVS